MSRSFYGVHLSREVEIADNLKAVPLEQTEAFLDMEVVRNVAPPSGRRKRWEGVGAIVEAVPWRPELFPQGAGPGREYEMGSFYIDARDFVVLPSILHGAPMVSMAVFPHRTHRTVPLLLGKPRLSGKMGVDTWALGFASLGKPRELDGGALQEAKRLFFEPERDRYREYGPMIPRLSEAVARRATTQTTTRS